MMAEIFASGRVVDAILVLMLAEAVVLTILRIRFGRGPATLPLLCFLVAGAALMLALRAALTDAAWTSVAGWLLLAFLAHGADLALRWRRGG